jgi:azobenzene reductase
VLLLGGSLAQPSHSSALVRAAERAVAIGGASTCRWDIASRPLGPFAPRSMSIELGADARSLVATARAADALVIASPLYHNSYSGAVKDALDHLSARDVARKPVGLLSNSGGIASTQAIDHLRQVVRALLAIAIPQQVVTVDADYVLEGDRYRLANSGIEDRLDDFAAELLWLAMRIRNEDRPEDGRRSANGAATGGTRNLAATNERSG